ncbi:MAG: PepSY domain-containing protein, partial [Verrucomicrobia bacterium]|nr:PepSY domain-containing protein [Verrucomicrobiota bacterium]
MKSPGGSSSEVRLRRHRVSRWAHRWLSLVLGPVLILWAASGIVLDHREAVAHLSVDRNRLGPAYRYENWNQAAVRGGLRLDDGTLLLYGNIGIWKTDSGLGRFAPWMDGLPPGVDSRRTFKLLRSGAGGLYAGTQAGLYRFDPRDARWRHMALDLRDPRIVDLAEFEGRIAALSRDEILLLDDTAEAGAAKRVRLLPATDGDGRTSLFRTLWMIHSGKLYGRTGVFFVDALAIHLIFLCVTGYLYFFLPRWIRRRVLRGADPKPLVQVNRLTVRWHKRIGICAAVFLVAVAATGMFLRPPLLIPIAGRRVATAPGSVLAGSNAWVDRLRAFHWNAEGNYWIVGTDEGFYRVARGLDECPVRIEPGPPVSVMGINVFEPLGRGSYLVGSFAGLFVWHPESGTVRDYMTGEVP